MIPRDEGLVEGGSPDMRVGGSDGHDLSSVDILLNNTREIVLTISPPDGNGSIGSSSPDTILDDGHGSERTVMDPTRSSVVSCVDIIEQHFPISSNPDSVVVKHHAIDHMLLQGHHRHLLKSLRVPSFDGAFSGASTPDFSDGLLDDEDEGADGGLVGLPLFDEFKGTLGIPHTDRPIITSSPHRLQHLCQNVDSFVRQISRPLDLRHRQGVDVDESAIKAAAPEDLVTDEDGFDAERGNVDRGEGHHDLSAINRKICDRH